MSLVFSLIFLYIAYFAMRLHGRYKVQSNFIVSGIQKFSIAVLCGLFVALTDFFYFSLQLGLAADEFIEYYFSAYWEFTLHCLTLSLILFYLVRNHSAKLAFFPLAAMSGIVAYLLVFAGITLLFDDIANFEFYWLDTFIVNVTTLEMFDQEGFLSGIIIYPLAAIVFLFITFRFSASTSETDHLNSHIGGYSVAFKTSTNEPLRIIAGLAACGRLPGQSSLGEEVDHPAQAIPYPMDIDRNIILRLVNDRRRAQISRGFLYTLFLVIGFFIFFSTENVLGVYLSIFAATILFFRTLQNDKYKIAASYSPANFDEATLLSSSPSDQNLVCYAGSSPFANFGFVRESWMLTVDKARSRPGDDLNGNPYIALKPDVESIKESICRSLKGSGLQDANIRTLFFVQGKNIPLEVKRPGAYRPPEKLNPVEIKNVTSLQDAPVREYLWIRKPTWSSDVSLSYFLRVHQDLDDLNLEITAVIMPPIKSTHRWIDKLPPQRLRRSISDFLYSIAGGTALLFWSPIYLLFLMQKGLSEIFTNPEKAIKRSIDDQPDYDFGATASLREKMCDMNAISYFQNTDRQIAESAFTGRILRAFIDALDEFNIDTSELREQRSTLLNQGIIVQGGDLKAKNVAAGFGSKISDVKSRIPSRSKAGSSA